MPDKRAFSPSVGKAIFSLFRPLAAAGLIAASATWFASGCTDNSGNGHFMQDGAMAAGGAGGDMGGAGGGGGDSTGGGGAGGDNTGGTSGGGSGGNGNAGANGMGNGGTSGGGGGTAGAGGTAADGSVD